MQIHIPKFLRGGLSRCLPTIAQRAQVTCPGSHSRQRRVSNSGLPIPKFCLLSPHMCFLGFSHPGLLPTHSTSLHSPLPRLFGPPTGHIPAGSRNTAALRYGTPQGVPGGWTLPALYQDAVVTSEHHQPSLFSALRSQSRSTLVHVMH